MAKGISKRKANKYPSLEPKYNLKSRQEEIADIASYAHKLNPADKAWLAKFVEEEIIASFKGKKHLNKTKKERLTIYNRNNARNRDVFTKSKITGKLVYGTFNTDSGDRGESED